MPADADLIDAWRARIDRARRHLGWTDLHSVVRRHAGGTSLALTAPLDQLLLATEINEWALCAALLERDPARWSLLESELIAVAVGAGPAIAADPPVLDEAPALARFDGLARREASPPLRALVHSAEHHGLPHMLDEELLTLGAGRGGRDYPLAALPDPTLIDWSTLHDIPTALVTGSNGKTTTVRLLAACVRAQGLHAAYNCTDGVYLDGEPLAQGDYSGPAGARMALRDHRADVAILETARGGILRRGIAVSQAMTAVVTNVSADHFGEYGIDDLIGLARTKLAVAAAVTARGLLVLNADDPELRAQVPELAARYGRCPPLGWFSASRDPATLHQEACRDDTAHRAATGWPVRMSCGPRGGRLILIHAGAEHDLGAIAAMPLSMAGVATYNIANLAGAALAAAALGITPVTIAAVFACFGRQIGDNPGRMMQFRLNGARVLVDYAHNQDGLRGFLEVASHLRTGAGRLGILLGQAGNRSNVDIEALAQIAVGFRPDFVVVKENETQLRGRAPGDVPAILCAELARLGVPDSAVKVAASELEGARLALGEARPGDVLALPMHIASARSALVDELGRTDSAVERAR